MLGARWRRKSHPNSREAPEETPIVYIVAALFVEQGVFTPLERLSLTLNGRYDRFQVVGQKWSWRGSLVYAPLENQSLRLACGTAFRNPATIENYLVMELPLVLGLEMTVKGNTGLDPESVTTYELGYYGTFIIPSRIKEDKEMSAETDHGRPVAVGSEPGQRGRAAGRGSLRTAVRGSAFGVTTSAISQTTLWL